jgi:hypothetical protein
MSHPLHLLAGTLAAGTLAVSALMPTPAAAAAAPDPLAAPPAMSAHVRPHVPHRPAAHRHRRTKAVFAVRRSRPVSPRSAAAPVTWHGGRVMSGVVHLYAIWYGDWSATGLARTVVTDALRGFGGTAYAGILGAYTAHGAGAATDVRFAGETSDAYSAGKRLSDTAVRRVVATSVGTGALPRDAQGVYLVLTSPDVRETSGFGRSYCGWHSHARIDAADLVYVFAGDPRTQAPTGCEPPVASTPNGDTAADGLASTVLHEVDESLTDPDLDAWFDRYGNENADKCAWTYGPAYPAANGAPADLRLAGRDLLIQQNWRLGAHPGCGMAP